MSKTHVPSRGTGASAPPSRSGCGRPRTLWAWECPKVLIPSLQPISSQKLSKSGRSRPFDSCAPSWSARLALGQGEEGDRGEVGDRGGDDQEVEDLVVAEGRRDGVRPLQRVDNGAG